MRIFGKEVSIPFFSKANRPVLSGVDGGFGGSGFWIREPYSGAWQNNDPMRAEDLLSYFAVFSCITLIASDISKLSPKLLRNTGDDIWSETTSPAFSPVLRKPNRYQNHIQFKEWWILSKLLYGNMFALKQRDERGVVVALYVLDPRRVQVLVAPDGSVYYSLNTDDLNNLPQAIVVPAREIIHDRMNCIYHPLVGVSPLYAAALAASQGLTIQSDSKSFFKNGARPSGILSAPSAISDQTASRLKSHWESNYSGMNSGKVAVLGDGLKFEAMRSNAVDSQLIEQMKWLPTQICSVFHVPPFKVQIGDFPSGQSIENLNLIYYSDCLQSHIESMELCLDEGLSLPSDITVQLDLDGLIRMDSKTQYDVLGNGIKNMILAPNEARAKVNLKSKPGGDQIWLQQQNWPMETLAERNSASAADIPGATPSSTSPSNETPSDQAMFFDIQNAKILASFLHKELTINED